MFIAGSADDQIVGLEGSLRLHELWRNAGRPVEMHLFERGGHGFGMRRQELPSDHRAELFVTWLDSRCD